MKRKLYISFNQSKSENWFSLHWKVLPMWASFDSGKAEKVWEFDFLLPLRILSLAQQPSSRHKETESARGFATNWNPIYSMLDRLFAVDKINRPTRKLQNLLKFSSFEQKPIARKILKLRMTENVLVEFDKFDSVSSSSAINDIIIRLLSQTFPKQIDNQIPSIDPQKWLIFFLFLFLFPFNRNDNFRLIKARWTISVAGISYSVSIQSLITHNFSWPLIWFDVQSNEWSKI